MFQSKGDPCFFRRTDVNLLSKPPRKRIFFRLLGRLYFHYLPALIKRHPIDAHLTMGAW